MNELIKIENRKLGDDEVQTVNARELHRKLEVGRDFSNWVKGRIEDAQLIEGQDYVRSPELASAKTVGQGRIEYHLTVDSAKHLAMLERTEIGKEIRQYFIDVEKKARQTFQAIQKIEDAPLVRLAKEHVALQLEQERQRDEQYKQSIKLAKHQILLEMETKRNTVQDTRIEEQKAEIARLQEELSQERQLRSDAIDDIRVKADTILEGMYQYRISTYARKRDIRLNLEEAKALGKLASKISRRENRRIGKVFDPICQRNVNTYDEDLLEVLFDEWENRRN